MGSEFQKKAENLSNYANAGSDFIVKVVQNPALDTANYILRESPFSPNKFDGTWKHIQSIAFDSANLANNPNLTGIEKLQIIANMTTHITSLFELKSPR